MTRSQAALLFAALACAGVLVRVLALPGPGFTSDVGTFQAWAERLAEGGPGSFYEPGYFADYPPGFLYVLWLLGALFDGEALRLAVKAVSIPFDIGIAALVARLVASRSGRRAAVAAAGIWLLAPAPVIAGPFWGQVDSVGTLPALGAIALAGRGRWAAAGAVAGVAAMVKPQFGVAILVIAVAAMIVAARGGRRPLLAILTAAATAVALGLPFRAGPLELVGLVRDAAAGYPYTSLYAFNIWSLAVDFWQPDDAYVAIGGALLVAGLVASCSPLRRPRETAALLTAAGLATMAFYFLPTRAHERYLYPAFALLLPMAMRRRAMLTPYLVLFVTFALTLLYAISRYPQNGIVPPAPLEATLFTAGGVALLKLVMLGSGAAVAYLAALGRDDVARAVPPTLPAVPVAAPPAVLRVGRAPTRRDLLLALLVALVMLGTRGYRLDWPREMYFDEVYHARTAFELLAEREPYEWTHPHLAKQIMALSVMAFGGDRVTGTESLRPGITALAVSNDGVRAFAVDDQVFVRARDGVARPGGARVGETVRALAFEDERLFILTDRRLAEVARDPEGGPLQSAELAIGRGLGLHVSGSHLVVAGTAGVAIYPTASVFDAAPLVVPIPAVAVTGKPGGNELFVLDQAGTVHVVDAATGADTRQLQAGPARALAFAAAPERLFAASASGPTLTVVELEGGRIEGVPLSNARTGAFAEPASALAMIPRSGFLYAAVEGRVVVIDPAGASPFASIAAPGTLLAVDGEADELLVAAGDGSASRIETGRHALAWRLPGVVAGALLAFCVVLLARRLFWARTIAVIAGIAMVLDGSFFAQPRIGMNDIYVALFIAAGWYFVVAAHAPRRSARLDLALAGLCFGLAIATKWAGVYALAGVFIAAVAVTARGVWRGRRGEGGPLDLLGAFPRDAAFLFACFAVLPAACYLLAYYRWFGGPTIPYGWDLVELTRQMYSYHSGLTSPHPAGSPWWSWPLVLKPVYWYYGQAGDGQSAVIYDAGNVALFWPALGASIWLAVVAIRARAANAAFVLLAMLVQLAAWIPITRVLFFYHFFTALPFYLLALAVALASLWHDGKRALVIGGLTLATFAAVFFYPFVSGQPVPAAQSSVFFILPTWQYECQFYPAEGGGLRCAVGGGSFEAGALTARLALAAGVTLLVAMPLALIGRLRARA